MIFTFLAGLMAGLTHVFMGADHLSAIAPLAVQKPQKAWILGLRWGLGHTSGVAVAFGIVLLLRRAMDVVFFSKLGEPMVGITLIGIGLWGIRSGFKNRLHTHSHHHDGVHHEHIHIHPDESALAKPHAHEHTALFVGALHGLAGSSHILGILPALALPSTTLATAYMAAFGLGTILGMTAFSMALGRLTEVFALGKDVLYRRLLFGTSALTLCVGALWLANSFHI